MVGLSGGLVLDVLGTKSDAIFIAVVVDVCGVDGRKDGGSVCVASRVVCSIQRGESVVVSG